MFYPSVHLINHLSSRTVYFSIIPSIHPSICILFYHTIYSSICIFYRFTHPFLLILFYCSIHSSVHCSIVVLPCSWVFLLWNVTQLFSELTSDCVKVAFVRSLDYRCYPGSSVAAVPPQNLLSAARHDQLLMMNAGINKSCPCGHHLYCLSAIRPAYSLLKSSQLQECRAQIYDDFKCDLNLCTGSPPINSETKCIELDALLSGCLTDMDPWIHDLSCWWQHAWQVATITFMNGSNSVRELVPYPSVIADEPNFSWTHNT